MMQYKGYTGKVEFVDEAEIFVKKKRPTKRFRGWAYSKKAGVLSIYYSLNNFSLDRRIIGCPPSRVRYLFHKAPDEA